MSIDPRNKIKKYRRENYQRIFVNRNLYLDKIQFVGFDMDYTIAEYISPSYERLIYKHALKRLIEVGYPPEISKEPYNPKFATRGLLYDKEYGNFLKTDACGNIMSATHGFSYIEISYSRIIYKNRFVHLDDIQRFAIFNTLFEFPAMFMIAATVEHFEKSSDWKINDKSTGLERGSFQISYKTIHDDIVDAFNTIHKQKEMKQETIDHFNEYIRKDRRVPILLKRIKDAGRKTFLVTNSDYWYTNNVMKNLIAGANENGPDYSENWIDYFDVIFVDAQKPKFFAEGTSMSQIDLNTGKKHIGVFKGISKAGDVFAGGNSEILSEMLGANGKDILYVGDHIYGDILKSKKKQGWRTYLIVPELEHELYMWIKLAEQYESISKYDAILSNLYKNMDSKMHTRPKEVDEYADKIKAAVLEIEKSYGHLGSLLRCGYRQTFFADQLSRFADLYSYTCLNLLNYPFFYLFRSPAALLPHESTINVLEKTINTSMFEEPILESNKSIQSFRRAKQLTLCAEENGTEMNGENSS